MAAVAVGGTFVLVQSLAYSGYVNVDWAKVEREYRSLLDLDGDGKARCKLPLTLSPRALPVTPISSRGSSQRRYRRVPLTHTLHDDLCVLAQVTTNDVRVMAAKLQSVLLFNLPSGASFTGGLYYGLGGSAAAAGACFRYRPTLFHTAVPQPQQSSTTALSHARRLTPATEGG